MGMVNDKSTTDSKPSQSYWDKKDRSQMVGGLYHDIASIVAGRVTPKMSDAEVEAKWRHTRKLVFDSRIEEV